MFQRACIRLQVVVKHFRAVRMSSTSAGGGGEEEILFQAVNHTGLITMNRPKALNALNLSMVRKMTAQMKSWETDPHIGLVVIKGAGEKSFCAGGDIRAVTESKKKGDTLHDVFFPEEYILNHLIGSYKKPYVALIDGITMGGGVGLSVHGMFRVATERTKFAMPETAIGLFPDVGGGHFLPRLPGQLGIFLALTGFRLSSRDVARVGIATHFVDSSKIEELEESLTKLTSGASKEDVAAVLDRFQSQSTTDTQKDFALKDHVTDIDRLFSGATVEEIFKALEKDGSQWAVQQLDTLNRMSPTSMKITLRLLQEGKGRSLAEDLRVERRVVARCMEDKDFHEGVRAVLIDKDNKPQWNPAHINEVTQDKVDWYFSPLGADRELKL